MKISVKGLMGPAAVLGGVLWLGQWWLDAPLESLSFSVFWTLAAVQVLLLLSVLRGMLTLGGSGRFGKIGLVVAFVGTILMLVALALMPLPNAAGWAWFMGVPALTGGWLLFGLANMGSKVLPRWNALPLIIGLMAVLISILHDLLGIGWTLPVGIVTLGLGWVLLGYVLWSGAKRSVSLCHR